MLDLVITRRLLKVGERMKIVKSCPMCKKKMALSIDGVDFAKYLQKGTSLIQDILPNMGILEREFLISGYCPSCQNLLFGSDYKPNSDWEEVD